MSEILTDYGSLPTLTELPCQAVDADARADILEMCSGSSPRDIARMAMGVLFQDRRGRTSDCPEAGVCEDCIAPQVDRLTDAAEDGRPLQLMLLGFPCKSPNLDKVLGALPDAAEILSLQHLNGWAQAISSFYEPGAEIIVGADGRIFADLVEVPDKTVSAYIRGIKHIIKSLGLSVNYVGIDDFMPDLAERGDYDDIRDMVADDAIPTERLRQKSHEDPNFLNQVNGMSRFLEYDLGYVLDELSKTQLKKIARQRAYEIISRGDVLRDELELHFPQAARLSIHPQTDHCSKFGVHITPSCDDWVTPWHASALQEPDGGFRLVKRRGAEREGAEIARFDNGQPSHLEISS